MLMSDRSTSEFLPSDSRENEFQIVSPQNADSLGSQNWKGYLKSKALKTAWSSAEGSPYKRFQKDKTIQSVDHIGSAIRPRYSEGEINSEQGIQTLIQSGILGKNTAVLLDSGGAHSVAMAVRLAEQVEYQPVVMFDSTPHPKGQNRSEQELATMLYFAQQMAGLKGSGKIRADAPPVFILDCHRADMSYGLERERERVRNTYTYNRRDFPTAEELQRHGIRRAVYVNEGDQNGRINPSYQSEDRLMSDLKPIISQWLEAGIEILYTGVKPWKDTGNRSFRTDF